MHALGKITAKGQTTVPREIREALKAGAGDTLLWELDESGVARVRRVQPLDVAYLGALEGALSEWSSEADEEAYRDL
jgi:bifunctional DNA-binding transcriptional regulator/antitoxin component of YhaV-PrlF toxin-antitoxin module